MTAYVPEQCLEIPLFQIDISERRLVFLSDINYYSGLSTRGGSYILGRQLPRPVVKKSLRQPQKLEIQLYCLD